MAIGAEGGSADGDARIGVAARGAEAAASPAASAASVASSARSAPCEFRRPGKSAAGSGMLACGTPPPFSASATGSTTSDAMLTAGSTMRLTNELFAPFSSSRRTRYARSVSCDPTGA